MDRLELYNQVNRLYDNFAISASETLRQNKTTFLYKELPHTNTQDFIKAVHHILRDPSIRSFPTLQQIRGHLAVISSQHTEASPEFCSQCENSGYYTVWQLHDDSYYAFAFRCPCNTSHDLSMRIIDQAAIPIRAHNPFPPTDVRHKIFNSRKAVS